MNIVNFTPIESLLGGLIIGLAVAILYLMRGNYTGISGIYFNVISANKIGFLWRLLFIVGLIIGPVIRKDVDPDCWLRFARRGLLEALLTTASLQPSSGST